MDSLIVTVAKHLSKEVVHIAEHILILIQGFV